VLGAASPEAASLTRTTVAATEVHSGVAKNVLPQKAVVNFNARVMPGAPSLSFGNP
jgi:acetylornithine deacetylase/succinyl-diaminopimelate desuccinylase-like protein